MVYGHTRLTSITSTKYYSPITPISCRSSSLAYGILTLSGNTENQATTVMAVSDTFSDHPVVFAWSEESIRDTITKTEWIDRYEGYELRTYPNEHEMHDGFLTYLEECNPDMLVAHAIAWADLPHLYQQLGVERERLSPVRRVIAPNKKTGAYRTTAQPYQGATDIRHCGAVD